MNRQKLLQQVIGVTLVMLLLVGCGAPAVTPVSEAPAATSSPVPSVATSTSELPSLQTGGTFTIDSYQVKLIQVEERPTIIALTSDRIGAIDPKQNENAWLVLTIEIKNLENETSPLTLLPSSAAVLNADGRQAELSSVGVSVPEDQAIVLGFIEGQKLTRGFLGTGASGRVFVIPDGTQNLLLTGGARNIIGDPNGPQWDLGNVAPEETIQFSLLFEVPAGASELTWRFLGSAPLSLPESQTASLPDERGPGMTLEMTDDELCQVAEALELECPSTPVPSTSTSSPSPKAGHWEGKGSFGVYVRFDVTTNGDIRNFVIDIPIGASTCTMKLEEITIESDGTFIYSEKLKTGAETNRISGTFESATTLTGTVGPSILCGDMATGFSKELTWDAEWKNPESAVTAVTAEAMPTTTPIARATPMVSDVLLYDDFGSNANGWWVGESSKENSDKTAEIADGKYRYSVTSKKGTFRWNSLPNFTVKDFLLSVDVTLLEASGGQPGGTAGGFNFRVNENEDYYRLAIYDDNHFKVSLNQGGEWQTPLYPKTANSAINLSPGVVNNIVILAKGSTFTFYANGQELVTVTDTTLSEPGKIGLGVELDEGGQTATVEFDNLVIKAVP
jgi:hypothetical protein